MYRPFVQKKINFNIFRNILIFLLSQLTGFLWINKVNFHFEKLGIFFFLDNFTKLDKSV